MREAFMKSLFGLAEKDPNVMLITADLGYGVFEEFEKKYPNQYLNVGVAEHSMMGVASGLALEGRIIFTYSIGNFPTLRCLEHIRNDACYHELNINIVTSGGGFSYGGLGMSHHATEDLSIMRALPGINVIAPGTAWEAGEATIALCKDKKVGYLRIDKSKLDQPEISNNNFKIGRANIFREGKDITLIAAGGILEETVKASNELAKLGIESRVISLCSVKPLDVDMVRKACDETGGIITIEENNLVGGMGSAISETVLDNNFQPKVFKRIGLQDEYSSIVGSQQYLRSLYKINSIAIVNQIKKSLNLKDSEISALNLFKINALKVINLEKRYDKKRVKKYVKEGVILSPITKNDLENDKKIILLKEWREKNLDAFPTSSRITEEGTFRWLKNLVLDREDRLMFFVKDIFGETIGHVGISSFDYQNKTCEVDNIVRGKISLQKNAMKYAMQGLLCWIDENISPEFIYLRVFNDNTNAINLYDKLGFQLDALHRIKKVENINKLKHHSSENEVERFFISMRIKCNEINKG
ncbi:GNAT family N-acetyltransferase [Candidatus Thioglobus sp.]|nr:GNAT family N-acetyltransferase [Candidatus Thioglobus sp.]